MNRIFFILAFFYALSSSAQNLPNARLFLDKFEPFLGQYFEGEIIAGAKEGDAFTGKKLLMHVMSYNNREVKIPFFVGDDKSRTWILSYSNSVITLKHDHRHEDGTADEITFYGGTSNNQGTETLQMFPADHETCNLINYACHNVWWITMDGQTFTYNLRRIGSDRLFSVKFDLTKPVVSDFKPW